MNKPRPVHFQPANTNRALLWCSGRAIWYALTSDRPADITCRSCERKYNKQIAAALAVYWGVPA
jgi:hypothetical protein